MRLIEILDNVPLYEMAYEQKKAEHIITGLEKPINDHILKLWTMPEASQKLHWLKELETWFDEIGEIVLKPNNRRPVPKFYYRILFDEPFGGAEIPNLMSRLKRLQRQGYQLTTDATPQDLIARLQQFHTSFAIQCAKAQVDETTLHQLLGV